MEPESSLPYSQVPARTCPYPEPTQVNLPYTGSNHSMYLKKMPLFRCLLRDTSSRNTPPGDPSGGVVYLRIVLSPEEASRLVSVS
jgi:hypothetical protein